MSLLNDLILTYDNYSGHEPDGMERIAPIAHTYKSTGQVIDVTIDQSGNFIHAELNSKNVSKTLLAVTEKSASRTSKSAAKTPHALNDELKFMVSHYLYDEDAKKFVKSDQSSESYRRIRTLSG